jgi:undecaprenyl-diphosphatase
MIFQAIILGLIQGVTEFLPISSSAHLLLVPYFFDWPDPGLGFDVALHWGTLLAIVFVFGKDYWRYAKAFFRTLYKANSWTDYDSRLAWLLILASIPGAIFGLIFEQQVETMFRDPLVTVFTLAGFGLILWLVDKKSNHQGTLTELSWLKALGIGVAQALAIIPGVSRSGATITAGLLVKLDREAATKFSFLLAGPIIFGAGLVALRHIGKIDAPVIVGFISAFISGIVAIKFLLKYIASHNFKLFVWYRYLLAIIVLLTIILK